MGKRPGYIFTNKKTPDRAIMSTILGVISCLSLIAVIYLCYVQKGNAPISYGLTGLLATLFSLAGLIMGIFTAIDKDSYKLFPGLGIFFNALALIVNGIVIYAGVYI